ncbi:hypothetical protein ABVK25_002369 [Lepraria finkii]|uniref:Uncharacterized protein n=1 Tax=Lepraria finkii TaxID=1340010 RepID=A0ABR4BKF4_9LECA
MTESVNRSLRDVDRDLIQQPELPMPVSSENFHYSAPAQNRKSFTVIAPQRHFPIVLHRSSQTPSHDSFQIQSQDTLHGHRVANPSASYEALGREAYSVIKPLMTYFMKSRPYRQDRDRFYLIQAQDIAHGCRVQNLQR